MRRSIPHRNIALLILVLLLVTIGVTTFLRARKLAQMTDFDSCARSGYPIQETYPAVCRLPNGKTFTQATSAQQTTVTGTAVCLPHKQVGDFHTLECAYGIRDESGANFKLSDPTSTYISEITMGQRYQITGSLIITPIDDRYTTLGTLTVRTIKTLN